MRERRRASFFDLFLPGITPAYAGKTRCKTLRSIAARDHPRVCGKDCRRLSRTVSNLGSPPRMRERLFQGVGVSSRGGSPPRMRERRALSKLLTHPLRITPAYAGKTKHKERKLKTRRDHPRVCGKDPIKAYARKKPRGSPPRMRERHL